MKRRRPSPATAIAFVALVAALSGSAIALPGKQRRQQRRHQEQQRPQQETSATTTSPVRTSRIWAAVTSRMEPLTGNRRQRVQLRQGAQRFPPDLATRASSSAATDGFQRYHKTAGATEGADFAAARTAAPEVALATTGPFSLYGKCFEDTTGDADETNDTVYAYTYIRTTEVDADPGQ